MLGEVRGVGELVFNGSRGSVWEKQKVPEMNNGDGHTMRMYLMTLNAALKRSENGKLYVCIFHHNKKRSVIKSQK